MTTKKISPQLAVISGGIILFSLLFIFGKTVAKKDKPAVNQPVAAESLSFPQILTNLKKELKPYQLDYLSRLENAVSRGDVKEQQIHVNHELAAFWKDSISEFLPYAWYTAEAAKLENSEKNLTFAAHLMESRLLDVEDAALQNWLATNAKVLFEKALALNPDNDSSKIGLGVCYMFGNISDNPMQGMQSIKAITDKNPGNVYGQKILIYGGMKTHQYEKAIERLKIVISKEPGNVEMIALLGDAYERKGDKENAITQYQELKKLVSDPAMKQDIQHHIDELRK